MQLPAEHHHPKFTISKTNILFPISVIGSARNVGVILVLSSSSSSYSLLVRSAFLNSPWDLLPPVSFSDLAVIALYLPPWHQCSPESAPTTTRVILENQIRSRRFQLRILWWCLLVFRNLKLSVKFLMIWTLSFPFPLLLALAMHPVFHLLRSALWLPQGHPSVPLHVQFFCTECSFPDSFLLCHSGRLLLALPVPASLPDLLTCQIRGSP